MKLSKCLQRLTKLFSVAILGLAISIPSIAQQDSNSRLLVSGQATMVDGDVEMAYARATLDALRTAAIQRKGQITSHSMVSSDGQLTENISLQAHLNIRQMDVLEQVETKGIATVRLALELEENKIDCQPPQLTQVVTTDLAPPPNNNSYHQIDINQLLLDAEAQFSELAKSVNFMTQRINPALNTYQTAWLASEAYNQADYHLAIGAQWLPSTSSQIIVTDLSSLVSSFSAPTIQSPTLMLSATFSSPYRPDIDLRRQQQFILPANHSISQSSKPIPLELSQQVAHWVQEAWDNIHQTVKCEGSYIKLSKIIGQPLWRINKGQKLGLEEGQQLLLLPQNYQDGILNPDATSAPLVFKVTQLQPHAALLEHIAGPDNITTTTAQVIVF